MKFMLSLVVVLVASSVKADDGYRVAPQSESTPKLSAPKATVKSAVKPASKSKVKTVVKPVSATAATDVPAIEVTEEVGPVVWFEETSQWGRLRKRVADSTWIIAEVAKPGEHFVFVQKVRKRGLLGRVTETTTVQTVQGDPYGFLNWLNSTRAAYGLSAVGYDPNLTAWASQNNASQNAFGMGHHVMGPARRQNAGMGNYSSMPSMWMASPGHRDALLDPSIRWIGIAGSGMYWTFNAY